MGATLYPLPVLAGVFYIMLLPVYVFPDEGKGAHSSLWVNAGAISTVGGATLIPP